MTLPRTARDIARLPPSMEAEYEAYARRLVESGDWEFPQPTEGNVEAMALADQLYWLFKAANPVPRAVRGSNLETFFAQNAARPHGLPEGFVVERTATLSAVGDLMDHPWLPRSEATLYRDVRELIFGADLSMANLECVIDDDTREFIIVPPKPPPLVYRHSHFEVASGGRDGRFHFMATACNHSLDLGEPGARSTLTTLRALDIASHGLNATPADAERATIIEVRGLRVGLLSHTFGLNGHAPAPGREWLVNHTALNQPGASVDFTRFERQVAFCREQAVDLVVAQLHWGLEHERYPRPAQLDVAHHLAELGADVIIGHHPHVLQPMEWYRPQRDVQRQVPIFYSLGNLLTPFSHPAFTASGVARLVITKGRDASGETRTLVAEARIEEVVQHADPLTQTLSLRRAEN